VKVRASAEVSRISLVRPALALDSRLTRSSSPPPPLNNTPCHYPSTTRMSFKFALNTKNKPANEPSTAKPGKRKPLFDDVEEDVKAKTKAADAAQEIGEFSFKESVPSKLAPKRAKKGQPIAAPPPRKPKARADDPTAVENSASAKEAENRAQEALEADAKIYDYDAAYDALHARAAGKRAAEQEDVLQRRPKYMDSLFESAAQRKKDRLRAQDKLLQREREAEGDEFADKEKFVTGAYKAQQEETRRAEEEEKKRQEAEEEKRKKFGMQSFHKQMLIEQEKRHQEAMDAAAEASKEGYVAPIQEKDESEAELVETLRKQGKTVLLNEEGQVADKRQLLSAGLNIVAKPRPATQPPVSSRPADPQTAFQAPKSRNAQRARQTEMVAQQIEAAAKRKAEEEAEEQAKIQEASKSQKTSADIMGAKERYLQRKKEAAAAKAAAGKS
jgi:coiled-coil domain-containing protein 55